MNIVGFKGVKHDVIGTPCDIMTTRVANIADIVEIVGLKVSNSSAKTQKENAVAPRLTLSLPTLLLCEAGQEH